MPEAGARLVLGSGPFWHAIAPVHCVKNARPFPASMAVIKLQVAAVKADIKVDPTIFVVDVLPAHCDESALQLNSSTKVCIKPVSEPCLPKPFGKASILQLGG